MIEISDQFERKGPFGKEYPRVFKAESLEDMQEGRAEMAKGIRRQMDVMIPMINFGDQPGGIYGPKVSSVIYLPPLQHYPAMDPKGDIKRLYGLTLHDNHAMTLYDQTGKINVWFYENSYLDFPFTTCFQDEDFRGNRRFNLERWKAWREVSWKYPVILFAQYSEATGSFFKHAFEELKTGPVQDQPVTEYYWLLHIFGSGKGLQRRIREKVTAPLESPIPVFN